MRIISGNFKGKKLFLPNDKLTRPLKDVVKESIFNLILHSKKINLIIENSLILDLFSGSGSFGIECISRGAKKVIFFENYPEAIKILEKNLNLLKNIDGYEIYKKNFFNFFSSNIDLNLKFDVIFIDPPYKEKKINEIIEIILEKKILTQNGILIIHRHKKDNIKLTNKLRIIEDRTYGISKILFGN
jgi:16S rRNA (guanine966-N2)-methyltransferase